MIFSSLLRPSAACPAGMPPVGFDRYFDRGSGRFSAFYGNENATRVRGRGALFDRLRFAGDEAAATGAKTVLDVVYGYERPWITELARMAHLEETEVRPLAKARFVVHFTRPANGQGSR